MGYSVTSEVIEQATQSEEIEFQQLDAPTGTYVIGAFVDDDGADPAWATGEYVVDSEDRVTGMLLARNPSRDTNGHLICVGPDPSGSQALTAGVGAVSFPALTANSRVFLERRTAAGTVTGNEYRVTSRTPGTGFTITAVVLATGLTGVLDTSTIDWHVVEP